MARDGRGMPYQVDDNPFHPHHAGDAVKADVLVVSHVLSLIDLKGGGKLLPKARVIVHDEADTLASVAEMYARKKIRPDSLRNALRKAFPKKTYPEKPQPVEALDSLLSEMLNWFSGEYNRLNPVDENGFPNRSCPVLDVHLEERAPVTISALAYLKMLSEAVSNVTGIKTPATMSGEMRRFYAVLKHVQQELKLANDAYPAKVGMHQLDLDEQGLSKRGRYEDRMALGLSWSPSHKFPAFEVVDLYAGRIFSKEWYFRSEELQSVLLTSATLRTPASKSGKSGEWSYMTRLLGIPENSGRDVSVKRFGEVAKIHLMKSDEKPFLPKGPDGETRYNSQWVSDTRLMLNAMLKTGERGLVLANSFRDVITLMEGMGAGFWWQTDSVNMHWSDGVEALRSGNARIMVTPSVWAGANIRDASGGQLFRHLGFLRTPYPPLDVLKEKMLTHYFRQVGLKNGGDPAAVAHLTVRNNADQAGRHKMTQGLGRGIRAPGDIIEIWLMEPRLGAPAWRATFPERFRGLFDTPGVLLHFDPLAERENRNAVLRSKSDIINLLKKPVSPKNSGKGKPKGEDDAA